MESDVRKELIKLINNTIHPTVYDRLADAILERFCVGTEHQFRHIQDMNTCRSTGGCSFECVTCGKEKSK